MDNHLKSHIGYWLNRIRMEVHQSFEQRLDRYRISVAQWCILVALYDGKASSVGELADYIEIDKASISRVVERLVALHLISHIPGKDRRSGFITLTEKGKKLVPKLLHEAELNEQQFFGHLTEAELHQLQHIFKKIVFTVPSIQCDGWLQKPEGVSMSNAHTIITTILKESKEQQWPYPKIFEALKNAGVTEYAVSWQSGDYQATYTGSFGTVHEPAPADFEPVVVAKQYNLNAAKEALRENQQKKIGYTEWVNKMSAAGISHYHVAMNNRSVTYYNPSETEQFTEHVPTIK